MMAFVLGDDYHLPFTTSGVGDTTWRGRSQHETFAIPVVFHLLAIQVRVARVSANNDNEAS